MSSYMINLIYFIFGVVLVVLSCQLLQYIWNLKSEENTDDTGNSDSPVIDEPKEPNSPRFSIVGSIYDNQDKSA